MSAISLYHIHSKEIDLISFNNSPLNQRPVDSDFTTEHYRKLLILAKQQYAFASYRNIPWGKKFVLWRHDCDYSLNRALVLASIEAAEGVKATYFLNPHCEFYNLFEKKQYSLVVDILKMGHDIGLHFDAAFHNISDEDQLSNQISAEAALLESLFDLKPSAFSFHNPIAAHLSCEKEMYGNLVNCYSQRFKAEVPYCSDSNGYWRFRRLKDVLNEAKDPCLQVLTHPGWWQETAMPPRQRIFRSAYGRAAATLQEYDSGLESHDRLNHAGPAEALLFLKKVSPRLFELCDYLWNTDHLQALFFELWRLHERQLDKLCIAEMHKQWKIPAIELNDFFKDKSLTIDRSKLFKSVFKKDWFIIENIDQSSCPEFLILSNLPSKYFDSSITHQQLEDGCKFLCNTTKALASWGKMQAINFDGISNLELTNSGTGKIEGYHIVNWPKETAGDADEFFWHRWEQVKISSQKVGNN